MLKLNIYFDYSDRIFSLRIASFIFSMNATEKSR